MSSSTTGNLGTAYNASHGTSSLDFNNNQWNFSESDYQSGLSVDYRHQYGTTDVTSNELSDGSSGSSSGSYSPSVVDLSPDVTYKGRSKAIFSYLANTGGGLPYYAKQVTKTGTTKTKKLQAKPAVAGTPTASGITSGAATLTALYYANIAESTCLAKIQYKRSVDPDTSYVDAVDEYSATGYAQQQVTPTAISGLTPATQYSMRLVLVRTTLLDADNLYISSVGTFTTLAGVPAVTTNAASNLANTSAQLNGTLDINSGTGVQCYFVWDTVNPPTANTTPHQSKSADCTFGQSIAGLTQSTTYYYKAIITFSTPSGSPLSGSVVSFTTTTDPDSLAAQEARMQVYEYKRKYGVILTAQPLFFTLQTPSGTNSNTFVVGATVGAADCLISKDGGAFAQTTNQPATLGNGYTLVLTAAEMQANEIDIIIKDAAGGPDFRDAHLRVITNVQLGSVVIDAATGQKANTTAFSATGYGSGHGISAVAGATGQDIDGVLGDMVLRKNTATAGAAGTITLDAGATTTTDFYKGCLIYIIGGTGIGQSRVITGYTSGRVASVHRNWNTNPSTDSVYVIIPGPDTWEIPNTADLSGIPAVTATMRELFTFLFDRFLMKRTQTATTHTQYNAAGSSIGTCAVSDSGGTQTFNKLA